MQRIQDSIASFSLALAIAAALTASTAVARADAWDKKTTVSFSQPVEVPGYVLQPGKYVMKLVDLPADRHVVQFMNERQSHVYAAAMAIPAYRTEVSDRTVITFYEARSGQPEPMRYWYYPGDNFGQEFVYPKEHLAEIAAVPHETTPAALDTRSQTAAPVVAAETVSEPAPTAVVSEPPAATESSSPVEIAQAATPTQPTPVAEQQVQTPAPPSELPKTNSNAAEIALLGLASIGGALTARRLRN